MRTGRRRRVLIHRRISLCASGATARGRRCGLRASCGVRFVCRTGAALPDAALRGRRIMRHSLRMHGPGSRGTARCRERRMDRIQMHPPVPDLRYTFATFPSRRLRRRERRCMSGNPPFMTVAERWIARRALHRQRLRIEATQSVSKDA